MYVTSAKLMICYLMFVYNFVLLFEKLKEFWAPTDLSEGDAIEKSWPLPEAKHEFHLKNSCGLRYEAEATRLCIRSNRLESDLMSHAESVSIAHIQDEIRRQIGVRYPADEE